MEHDAPNGKAELCGSPAERVIAVFGAAKASALVELTSEALRRWKRPMSKGGGGGLVPAQYQARFLCASDGRLTAADLIAEPRVD